MAREVTAKVARVNGTEWMKTKDGCTRMSAWGEGEEQREDQASAGSPGPEGRSDSGGGGEMLLQTDIFQRR